MSSVIKPIGPEEPQVYWKRRALVGGIALLVLLVLFFLLRPKGEPEPEAAAVDPAASSAPASIAPVPTGSASPSTSGMVDGQCADADMKVAVVASEATYPAGVNPQFTMTITNEGALTCQRDVGSGANEIVVSSGGVEVWSSDDCNLGSEAELVELKPTDPATVTVEWTRSTGCDGPPVAAGAYEVVGRNDKVRSTKAEFALQ